MGELLVKVPESDEEFQAMWQLNYEVFAGELGQHPRHPDGLLVDKFHHKNRYRAGDRFPDQKGKNGGDPPVYSQEGIPFYHSAGKTCRSASAGTEITGN